MAEMNEMEAIARACLYIPELARGVQGEVEIESMFGAEDWHRTRDELHKAQRTLREAGWRRVSRLERNAPYSHNVEVAVYTKRFDKPFYIVVEVTTRFGIYAAFKSYTSAPW